MTREPGALLPLREPWHAGDRIDERRITEGPEHLLGVAKGAGIGFALGPVGACALCGCHLRPRAELAEGLLCFSLARPERARINELLLHIEGELRGLCWRCAQSEDAIKATRARRRWMAAPGGPQ